MKIFYVHWHADEAEAAAEAMREAGHEVELETEDGGRAWKALRAAPPDVLVVSLARKPSHGRRTAAVTETHGDLSALPIVFVGGDEATVEKTREDFPDASFTDAAHLDEVLDGLAER